MINLLILKKKKICLKQKREAFKFKKVNGIQLLKIKKRKKLKELKNSKMILLIKLKKK